MFSGTSAYPGNWMTHNRAIAFCLLSTCIFISAISAFAQSDNSQNQQELRFANLKSLEEIPAIPGYEKPLTEQIAARLAAFHPAIDGLGNVVVTIGSGSPRRLLATGIDEPGFVVSAITGDGFLRVQRLPQNGLTPMFNELYSAQPVKIGTSTGAWLDGVVAGLSVHLEPGPARIRRNRATSIKCTSISEPFPPTKFAKQALTFSAQSQSTAVSSILAALNLPEPLLAIASVPLRFSRYLQISILRKLKVLSPSLSPFNSAQALAASSAFSPRCSRTR